ncbi:MAG TPA: hypothetical protein VNC78_01965 [Actinomycetota bacterium]|nr:hypothetical protein [Actinomycetota bacterium]
MRAVATTLTMLIVGTVLSSTVLAQPVSPRQETHIYNGSRGGSGNDETNLQELVFSPMKGERYALIQVVDNYNSSENVRVTVSQDVNGDGELEHQYEICGATPKPVAIAGGTDIDAVVETVGCDGTLGATMGYVEMLYFRSKSHFTKWQASRNGEFDPAKFRGTQRVTEATYQGGGVGAADRDVTLFHFKAGDGEALGGARFMVSANETFLSLEIADASGLPTRASVYVGNAAGTRFAGTFCGATQSPIRVEPGQEIMVQTSTGACADGSPAAATEGTVTATFYAPANP